MIAISRDNWIMLLLILDKHITLGTLVDIEKEHKYVEILGKYWAIISQLLCEYSANI